MKDRWSPIYSVTVDIVVFRTVDAELEVLLVERGRAPYAGRWALPGGFKEADETLIAAARRELAEETGLRSVRGLTQLKAYGDPGRDPRGNVVTVVFVGQVPARARVQGGDDAARAAFHPVAAVLARPRRLAFDHAKILRDAVSAWRNGVAT